MYTMNGHNAHQKILDLLASQKEPITKTTIVNQTSLSEYTVDETLTELRKANLAQVTNGHWSITPEGREQHSINPNFSAAFLRKSVKSESRENWAELLGPEVINSQLGRFILQEADKDNLDYMLPYLRFFVLCWLRAEGITVNFNEAIPTSAYNPDSPEGIVHGILDDISKKVN
jgi:predicted transcriptional regulator